MKQKYVEWSPMGGWPRWTVEESLGYKPFTTFWQDFRIADAFGYGAVADTFRTARKEWAHDGAYIAEMALVLNHSGWMFHSLTENENVREPYRTHYKALCGLYFKLWRELDCWEAGYTDAGGAWHEPGLRGKDLETYTAVTD